MTRATRAAALTALIAAGGLLLAALLFHGGTDCPADSDIRPPAAQPGPPIP